MFIRVILIKREQKSDLGKSLVDREADTPKLYVRIKANEIEEKLNASYSRWDEELQLWGAKKKKGGLKLRWHWGGMPSYEVFILVGAMVLGLLVILWGMWRWHKSWRASGDRIRTAIGFHYVRPQSGASRKTTGSMKEVEHIRDVETGCASFLEVGEQIELRIPREMEE